MKGDLRITPIDISVEKKRVILGLENENILPVILGCIGSFSLFALSSNGAFLHCFLPFLLSTSYVLLLKNGKPPHFKEDFFDKHINGVTGFNLKGEASIKKKVYEI